LNNLGRSAGVTVLGMRRTPAVTSRNWNNFHD